jgi:hypothetical protein
MFIDRPRTPSTPKTGQPQLSFPPRLSRLPCDQTVAFDLLVRLRPFESFLPPTSSEMPDSQPEYFSPGIIHSDTRPGLRLNPSECSMSASRPKIAIPRVSQLQSYGNRRVKRACVECRQQKAKCNGHQPCNRCTKLGSFCAYAKGKRETIEKRLQELEKQVQAYNWLLKEIQPRADSQDRDLIARTRAQVRCIFS